VLPPREVLSEEQVQLVLNVARQAQDTKLPKCVPGACAALCPAQQQTHTRLACVGSWRRRWTCFNGWWRTACSRADARCAATVCWQRRRHRT
jgi:hypothetical protein